MAGSHSPRGPYKHHRNKSGRGSQGFDDDTPKNTRSVCDGHPMGGRTDANRQRIRHIWQYMSLPPRTPFTGLTRQNLVQVHKTFNESFPLQTSDLYLRPDSGNDFRTFDRTAQHAECRSTPVWNGTARLNGFRRDRDRRDGLSVGPVKPVRIAGGHDGWRLNPGPVPAALPPAEDHFRSEVQRFRIHANDREAIRFRPREPCRQAGPPTASHDHECA